MEQIKAVILDNSISERQGWAGNQTQTGQSQCWGGLYYLCSPLSRLGMVPLSQVSGNMAKKSDSLRDKNSCMIGAWDMRHRACKMCELDVKEKGHQQTERARKERKWCCDDGEMTPLWSLHCSTWSNFHLQTEGFKIQKFLEGSALIRAPALVGWSWQSGAFVVQFALFCKACDLLAGCSLCWDCAQKSRTIPPRWRLNSNENALQTLTKSQFFLSSMHY